MYTKIDIKLIKCTHIWGFTNEQGRIKCTHNWRIAMTKGKKGRPKEFEDLTDEHFKIPKAMQNEVKEKVKEFGLKNKSLFYRIATDYALKNFNKIMRPNNKKKITSQEAYKIIGYFDGIVNDAYKLGDMNGTQQSIMSKLKRTYLEVSYHHAKQECLKKTLGFVQTNYKTLEKYDHFGDYYSKLMECIELF